MTTKTTRRALLAGLPAVAAAMAPATATALSGLPAQPAEDPILAAILEHRAAVKAREAVLETAIDGHEPECYAAGSREFAAHDALFTIVPTTIAGVAAWLHHVGSPEYDGEEGCIVTAEIDEEFENAVARQLRAIAAVLRGQS